MTRTQGPLALRLTAISLILAPLLETVEAVLSPLNGGSTAGDVTAIAAHQTRFTVSVLAGLAATFLYVPAFLGAGRMVSERSRRVAATATTLLVLAMLGFAGVRMGQAIELAAVHQHLPAATMGALLDATTGTAPGAALMAAFLLGSTVGLWLLAVALWRSHAVPRAAAVAVAAFPVVDLGLHGHVATIASHLVLLAGLATVGVRILTGGTAPARVPARIAPTQAQAQTQAQT